MTEGIAHMRVTSSNLRFQKHYQRCFDIAPSVPQELVYSVSERRQRVAPCSSISVAPPFTSSEYFTSCTCLE